MGVKTGIEWTDATWNPIRGCSRVSEGCRNCYAERVAARFGGSLAHQDKSDMPYYGLAEMTAHGPRWTGEVELVKERLGDPLRWKKPRRIFVNSMSDLFHPGVKDEWIRLIFRIMQDAPQHIFQILTKRPQRMKEWKALAHPSMQHIWAGVSVEDQKTADERIPLLLATPAAVRWVSYEPALQTVNFIPYLDPSCSAFNRVEGARVDWLVCGGESGPGARPMHPEWARGVRDQCQAAGVPFFFKQWGALVPCDRWEPGSINLGDVSMKRVGKKAAGRLLDGREWNDYPDVRG